MLKIRGNCGNNPRGWEELVVGKKERQGRGRLVLAVVREAKAVCAEPRRWLLRFGA